MNAWKTTMNSRWKIVYTKHALKDKKIACGSGFKKTIESILEIMKNDPNLKCVHLGGFGEPLSHPHIFSFIESLKKLNLQVELISNGSLLNDQRIDELIRLGLDKLFISLDGPDETEYNDIRFSCSRLSLSLLYRL
ncbi:coenzyme PQQ synthesis protein E [Peptococcaceae bacterium CEB3]|nr:coenzyme PQQ synthesis protein E [Peptococcaceae bacterium CEB3]